ncbi:MAG: nitroreductase family deazaflavin-dependent oxidoreductase [Proteobacteria bacterium]|nr:nitroreductase family deazaflavin-dependent oxidoreductase [Pseudomonadota bacterium]
MKAAKIIAIVLVVYVGIVIAFESLLGYFQPANQSTLVITTTDADGASHDRVVARLRSNGQLYVAANHWPRAWFRQTSTNPAVEIEMDGIRASYTAVPVAGEEHDRVDDDNSLGFVFRVLTGFPPRYFVRLEPR